MFNTLNKRTMICNLISVVLAITLLVLQFLPFWQYEGYNMETAEPFNDEASIQEYVWLCYQLKFDGINTWFENKVRETTGTQITFDALTKNNMITFLALGFIACLFTIALCFTKNDRRWVSAFPFIAGLLSTIGYLTQPMLQLNPIWIVHLCVSILLLLVSVLTMIFGAKERS